MRAVDVGFDVVGLDLDETRIKRLGIADSYVEDVPDEALGAALASGRYRPCSDYRSVAGFDVAVITVPTPLQEGVPDLGYIEVAGRELARYLRPGALVVLESTTYPGTTEELLRPLLEDGSGLVAGEDFFLGYSPERVDPGNRTFSLTNTPKVVAGLEAGSLTAIKVFYGALVERIVPVSSCRVAELTKLLENTFRHVNIALVNELAMFAHDLGVDVWEALDASETKPFGFMRFDPGPGVGGHCLPVDPSYLSWRVKRTTGHSFRFVELANDINDHMPDYVVDRVAAALNERQLALKGARLLLLGLSYKADSGDVRVSPAVRIAELLSDRGALVRAADPHVDPVALLAVQRVELSRREVDAADLVVILVNHTSWDLSLLAAAPDKVLDTRNVPGLQAVERL
jgi:nucleotide sugar dehydrogenase